MESDINKSFLTNTRSRWLNGVTEGHAWSLNLKWQEQISAKNQYKSPCNPLVYNIIWPYGMWSWRKTGHNVGKNHFFVTLAFGFLVKNWFSNHLLTVNSPLQSGRRVGWGRRAGQVEQISDFVNLGPILQTLFDHNWHT